MIGVAGDGGAVVLSCSITRNTCREGGVGGGKGRGWWVGKGWGGGGGGGGGGGWGVVCVIRPDRN